MYHKFSTAFVLVLIAQLLLLFSGFNSASAAPTPSGSVIFSVYSSNDVSAIATQYKLSSVSNLLSANNYVAKVPNTTTPSAVATAMSSDSRVSSVSPNYGITLNESGSYFTMDNYSIRADPASGISLTTSEAYQTAATQWAWQKTQLNSVTIGNQGQGVIVAVLDTGVDYTHPDLANYTLHGYDATGINADGRDVQGHGTFVAGIIHQIAPKALILPIRVLDSNGIGTVDTLIKGLQYAYYAGAKVVNLSLSTNQDAPTLHQAIQAAKAQGMVVVSAAGNNDAGTPYFPAAYAENMGISATDQNDYRANFANWQAYMDVSGPGVNIYSTWSGGGYGWASGTSFSTPIVAAEVALLKSAHSTYTPDQIRSAVQAATDKFPTGCKCIGLGAGRINLSKIK